MTEPQRAIRVLVVDDEPAVLMTLAANLELEGFEVLEASDPREALALADHEDFDVMITDVRMPGMNGIELFREMRLKKPNLGVIAMTAFAAEDVLEQGIQEGVYTILRKPFEIAQVAALTTRAARRGVVLIVDDKPEVEQSLVAALQAAGIAAVGASSAEQALLQLAGSVVDTCVVDLVLPGVNGAVLCDTIRKQDGDITLLVMTGNNVPSLVMDATKAGSYTCLRKPFDVQALVRTVVRARRDR